MGRPEDPEPDTSSPYAVPLDDLIESVRVPHDDQVAEQSTDSEPGSRWAWDEQRRQRQLGGGA